jgi:hypothetical protein
MRSHVRTARSSTRTWPPALAVAVLSLATLWAGSARAQGTQHEREACTPDVFRLCAGEIPSVKRIVACLNAKRSQLSPACRVVMNGGERSAAQR